MTESEEPQGYYARFATGMSTLLMASGVAILGLILLCMMLMIYVAAYVFPLIGAGIALMGLVVIIGGYPGTGVGGILMGLVFIGLGSAFYHEYFLKWHSDLPKLTELPNYLSETIGGFISKPDE